MDSRPEPIYAKVQKGKKSLSKNGSSKVIPPPPPMPKITQEPRKPASHFSSPAVFVPSANQEEHRVPSRDENRHTYIPSDIKSVVAQPRHVIEKQEEFDRSEWRCILSRANSSVVCTRTENFCSKGTQTDVFQENSSDGLSVTYRQIPMTIFADLINFLNRWWYQLFRESVLVTISVEPYLKAQKILWLGVITCFRREIL